MNKPIDTSIKLVLPTREYAEDLWTFREEVHEKDAGDGSMIKRYWIVCK